MSAAAEEIAVGDVARDDQSGQALAETWSLEYLKASSVSVDPRALSLLERADCKRLGAIPLAVGSGGALVAVCAPSEERFEAIRELTGDQTRFTLISAGTLDALLSSRMFAEPHSRSPESPARDEAAASEEGTAEQEEVGLGGPAAAAARRKRRERDEIDQPPPSGEPAASMNAPDPLEDAPAPVDESPEPVDEPPSPAPVDAPAPAPAPVADASVESIVGAVLNALKHRVGSSSDLPTVEPSSEPAHAQVPDSTAELLAHLDTTVETWSALRGALAGVHAEFEETKRVLREVKEQLSVAHADNDQYRKRARTLEGELAESREVVSQARARLQEAADLLEADPTQVAESADLL